MKALLLADGSRGDVQPFVALAKDLRDAGHDTLLGLPGSSVPLAEAYGLAVAPLDDVHKRLTMQRLAPVTVEGGWQRVRAAVRLAHRMPSIVSGRFQELAELAESGPDIVVHNVLFPGSHLAERLDVPGVPVCTLPSWVPTDAFPDPHFPYRVPRGWNRLSYRLTKAMPSNLALGLATRRAVARARRDVLRLPGRVRGNSDILRRSDGSPEIVLQAFSRHMLPGPLNYPDWARVTGFWFLPAPPAWTPPEDLLEFLADGAPPVCVGFGSMVGARPARTTRIVFDAIRQAGVRAVVVTGWGGVRPADLGPDVLCVDQVPYDWLFPRMAAVVHHGGGTIGAALAAGRPQVICPFMLDQPIVAGQMHALGVSPPPQPQERLTSSGLAEAIRVAVSDNTMSRNASRLAGRVRAEDGLGVTRRILESMVAGLPLRSPSRRPA